MNDFSTKIILALVIFMFFPGCVKSPDASLAEAVEKYFKGDPDSLRRIERAFIRKISKENFNASGFFCVDDTLCKKKNRSIRIKYPFERDISSDVLNQLSSFYVGDEFAAASDGLVIEIYNLRGGIIHTLTPEVKNKKVLALSGYGTRLLYYAGDTVYFFDLRTNARGQLLKETFSPPNQVSMSVSLVRKGDTLLILTGAAGLYHMSLVNLSNIRVVEKNIQVSSSKIFINREFVSYLSGGSGEWRLVRFIPATREIKLIRTFDDIIDIELLERGFVVENKKGISFSDYNSTLGVVFAYRLFGRVNDEVLLKYDDRIYAAELNVINDELKALKKKKPELFQI